MKAFTSLYLPDGTAEQVSWFADLQRRTTSPENAVRIRQSHRSARRTGVGEVHE
jgi:hypothetical protein